jgi:hypothetical protein
MASAVSATAASSSMTVDQPTSRCNGLGARLLDPRPLSVALAEITLNAKAVVRTFADDYLVIG